jgi:predicted nucleotidyltransferase
MIRRGVEDNMHMSSLPIQLEQGKIVDFCRTWKVSEFSIFGSVLRDDFRPDSDVDVLITFRGDARPTLFTLAAMQQELEQMLGRRVDLAERDSVESSPNEHRRRSILDSHRVLYAA